LNKEYVKEPKNTSNRLLWQNRKTWAKNDEMFLGDLETHENPADPFRSEYHKFEKKD